MTLVDNKLIPPNALPQNLTLSICGRINLINIKEFMSLTNTRILPSSHTHRVLSPRHGQVVKIGHC